MLRCQAVAAFARAGAVRCAADTGAHRDGKAGSEVDGRYNDGRRGPSLYSVVRILGVDFQLTARMRQRRHSFATRLLEDRYDICAVQELLGHRDVRRTTMTYLDVMKRGALRG